MVDVMGFLKQLLGGDEAAASMGGGAQPGYVGSTAAQRAGIGYDNALLGNDALTTPGAVGTPSFMDGLTGWKGKDGIEHNGWGGTALGLGQGVMNGFMGMKQYGLAKDTLDENKRQFQMNFDAQRKMTNNQLSDRQHARVASNPGAYASEAEYMKKYGV